MFALTIAGLAKWQDRMTPLYNLVGLQSRTGTRSPHSRHRRSRVETVKHGEVPKAPKVERPLIVGSARR